jgi:beta-1,4-N-acetylglucosaminyltransferase
MIRFLNTLPLDKYSPRVYVVANTDQDSAGHAASFEQSKQQNASLHSIKIIPRSREVGQSYSSSVFTTIKSLIFSVRMMLTEKPDVLLTNGPGTCVPIAVLALMLKVRHNKA